MASANIFTEEFVDLSSNVGLYVRWGSLQFWEVVGGTIEVAVDFWFLGGLSKNSCLGCCLRWTHIILFFIAEMLYVHIVPAGNHLGKFVFLGNWKIGCEICLTRFPTYFFLKYVQLISLTYFWYFCTWFRHMRETDSMSASLHAPHQKYTPNMASAGWW